MNTQHTVIYAGAADGAAKRARNDVREMYDISEDARLDTMQETVEDAIVNGERAPVATIVRVTVVR